MELARSSTRGPPYGEFESLCRLKLHIEAGQIAAVRYLDLALGRRVASMINRHMVMARRHALDRERSGCVGSIRHDEFGAFVSRDMKKSNDRSGHRLPAGRVGHTAGDRFAFEPDCELAIRRELDHLVVGHLFVYLTQAQPIGIGIEILEAELAVGARGHGAFNGEMLTADRNLRVTERLVTVEDPARKRQTSAEPEVSRLLTSRRQQYAAPRVPLPVKEGGLEEPGSSPQVAERVVARSVQLRDSRLAGLVHGTYSDLRQFLGLQAEDAASDRAAFPQHDFETFDDLTLDHHRLRQLAVSETVGTGPQPVASGGDILQCEEAIGVGTRLVCEHLVALHGFEDCGRRRHGLS